MLERIVGLATLSIDNIIHDDVKQNYHLNSIRNRMMMQVLNILFPWFHTKFPTFWFQLTMLHACEVLIIIYVGSVLFLEIDISALTKTVLSNKRNIYNSLAASFTTYSRLTRLVCYYFIEFCHSLNVLNYVRAFVRVLSLLLFRYGPTVVVHDHTIPYFLITILQDNTTRSLGGWND